MSSPSAPPGVRDPRLGREFGRKIRHRRRVDIGRIGQDEVVASVPTGANRSPCFSAMRSASPCSSTLRLATSSASAEQIDRVDRALGKDPRGENGERAAAGAEVEHGRDALGSPGQRVRLGEARS